MRFRQYLHQSVVKPSSGFGGSRSMLPRLVQGFTMASTARVNLPELLRLRNWKNEMQVFQKQNIARHFLSGLCGPASDPDIPRQVYVQRILVTFRQILFQSSFLHTL